MQIDLMVIRARSPHPPFKNLMKIIWARSPDLLVVAKAGNNNLARAKDNNAKQRESQDVLSQRREDRHNLAANAGHTHCIACDPNSVAHSNWQIRRKALHDAPLHRMEPAVNRKAVHW